MARAAIHPLQPPIVFVAVVALLVCAFIWLPMGSPSLSNGRVIETGVWMAKTSEHSWVKVQMADRQATVRLPDYWRCSVGDDLLVQRQRRLWGIAFDAASNCVPQPDEGPRMVSGPI